jgi:hypothetical protein
MRRPAEISVLLIVLFLQTLCLAQSAGPAQKLSGRTHHVWVYERVERIMGAGDNCKRGEEDDFSSDHKVTITRCENGKLVHTQQDDKLKQHADLLVQTCKTSLKTGLFE